MINDLLCVIPARGGSKGIPNKNIKSIGGIPLVEYSILSAIDAGIDKSQIRVSSDSDAILEIALRHKVVANERPPGISGDSSSTEDTLLHELGLHLSYEKHNDLPQRKHVLLLQPTSPIRLKGTLNRFIDFYLKHDYDSALTSTKFYDFFWRENNGLDSTYDPKNRPMRQGLQPQDYVHFDNGNMYIVSAKILQETQCRLGGRVGLFPISELEGMQIDTPEDLEIFRCIFNGTVNQKMGIFK